MKPAPCLPFLSFLSFVLLLLSGQGLLAQAPTSPDTLRAELSSSDYRVYEKALKSFVHMGANGAPSLVAVLKEHVQATEMPRPARLAAKGLSLQEDRARAVVPELMRELARGSDAYFRLVARVLGQIGPHAPKVSGSIKREILRRGLGHLDHEEVCIAASRLEVDTAAGEAALRAVLNGTDVAKKVLVSELLARQGAAGEWARDDLWALLRDGRHGGTVETWVPELGAYKRVWSSTLDDEYVNCALAHALVRVCPNKEVPLEAFLQLLAHPRPEYRREAAIGLGARGVGARVAVLDLVRTANESRDQVAWEAITALGQIGPRAQDAIPHLEYLARGRNKGRAVRAEVALVQIRR